MVVLDKKKILFYIGIVTMFIFAYIATGYNVSSIKKDSNIDVKTVQTVALPVDKKVIILDARSWSTR